MAIVTGSNSGIGRATAIALAKSGCDIGITWHSDRGGADRTAELVRAAGRNAEPRHLDLSDAASGAAVVDDLCAALGGLGALVNNAAVNHRAGILDDTLEGWRRTLEINLTGAFACAQAAARQMVAAGTGGRIVNITSVHERVPLIAGGAYAASKAGLGLMSQVLALELAPHQITVNAIAPGHIATPMNGYVGTERTIHRRPEIPLGRVGDPADVAATTAYLCSDAAGYVTGATFVVDGGLLLTSVVPLQKAIEETHVQRRARNVD